MRPKISYSKIPRSSGFTVIEVIVVIIVLGIIGVTAYSRLTNPNAYNAQAAQDAIISTIRASQQAALGRSNVSFEINAVGDYWEMESKTDTDSLLLVRVATDGVKLETGTADELLGLPTDSCSSGASFDTPVNSFELTFDNQGNLDTFSNTTVGTESMSDTFNGVRICVNDVVSASVCVSRSGYAYAGDCDE